MRKSSKVFCLLFAVLMLFTLSVTAFAGNETNDGNIKIQVATDKGSYGATGVAEITATITNVSGEDINNVTAQAVFDDLAPAGKRSSQTSKSVDVLKSGESFSFTYKSTLNKDEHDLNIFQKIILWFVRLFNGGYNADNNNIDVVAENVTEIEFGKFTAENVVQVGYEYNDSGNNDNNNYNDDNNNSDNSDDGDITDIPTYEELIKNVDIDESYDYNETDVSVDEKSGLTYINNIIILMFDDECTDDEKAKAINSISGKVVGGRKITDTIYVEVKKSSVEELEKMCEELSANYKLDAFLETAMTVDSQSLSNLPNDPWIGSDFVNWNVSNGYNISDSNWWILSTETQRAWNYNEYFNNINIGIVDIGFDKTHEDLNISVMSKENSYENHGTHVAGIIGATANNKKGITGIVNNKNLYGYSIGTDKIDKLDNRYFKSDIFKGLETLVENGCKVINFSLGYSGNLSNSNRVYIDATINKWGKEASKEIAKLLEKGYDFIVTQSAGNGAPESNGASNYLGVDALQNGLFCSITQDNCYSSKKVSVEQIMNRIIVVANANKLDNNNNYQLSIDSNGGSKVDIAAPGTWIYSTLAGIEDTNNLINSGQKYGNLSGTSMASPIVAGVASLVWSVNENFTGAQVKEMVCRTSKDGGILVKDNPASPTTGSFYLVNAKLAVEEAIKKTYWTGTVKGRIINQNNDVLTGVTLVATNTETNKKVTVENSKDGTFSMLLPCGNYNIVAYKCSTEKSVVQNKQIGYNEAIDLGDIEVYQGSANVIGKVKDKNTKNPVSNVSIEIYDMDSYNDSIVIKTNENGEFETTILQDDDYTFTFSHADYEIPYDKKVDVSTANIDLGDIFLSKDGYSNDDESGESGDTEERPVTASGECGADGDNVTWTLYEDGELVISGNGAMVDYVPYIPSERSPFYEFEEDILKVIIGEGITHIGEYTFNECRDITNVEIADSVISIGAYAFSYCENIEKVSIHDGVISVDSAAFFGCNKLKDITIADSVRGISASAFSCTAYYYDANNWEDNVLYIGNHLIFADREISGKYSIKDGTLTIASAAFANCENLTSIYMPNSVVSMGDNAFYYCVNLNNVRLSENLKEISYESFDDCFSLESIVIPKSVTYISNNSLISDNYILKYVTILNPNCNIGEYSIAMESDGIIYGYRNSTAERFAMKRNYQFVALD